MASRDHPVWAVYNEYRTVRLNVKYYQHKLASARRVSLAVEYVVAASSSTAVAGLWFFESVAGGYLWKALVTLAALCSLYQAVSKPSERVRKVEERAMKYRALDFDLQNLVQRIREDRIYGKQASEQFAAIVDRRTRLATSYVDTPVEVKLRDRVRNEVLAELPAGRFYVPPEVTHVYKAGTPPSAGVGSVDRDG